MLHYTGILELRLTWDIIQWSSGDLSVILDVVLIIWYGDYNDYQY